MSSLNDVSSLLRIAIATLGLAVATAVGVLVGESNWAPLIAISSVILVASLSQFTVHNFVSICLALVVLDLWMAPTGFKISPMEQIGAVAAFCYILVCWRRSFNPDAPSAFLALESFHFFRTTTLVAAAYAIAHFIYNFFQPYDELAFGWRGATKAYYQTFGAFLLVMLLANSKLLLPLGQRRSITLLRIFLVGLVIGTVVAVLRSFTIGVAPEEGLSREDYADLVRVFTIPVLNAHDNLFTMRTLGPAAALVGAVFFFSRPTGLAPLLPLSIMTMGFIGSVFSGGRAAILFCIVFLFAAVLRSGKVLLCFSLGGLLTIIVALILMVPSSMLKETPYFFQRSISYLKPDFANQATDGIQGSSDYRWRFFHYAWDQYTSGDARVILLGRSVGQMDSVDVLSFIINNEQAQMEFAVRRLSTHNGLTDLLLGWGLIGYLLNVAMCISCCVMLFSYLRRFRQRSHGACWIFSAAVFMAFWLVYTHIGGSFVWPLAIVFVLIALSQTDGLEKP